MTKIFIAGSRQISRLPAEVRRRTIAGVAAYKPIAKTDEKAEIPAGPNNPVGTTWIGLTKEHYGIHGTPDPDLLIRTSGEMRVSNFLLWQIAYAEIWVTDVLWPDFRRRHLLQAVLDFQKRERRYGGITPA